MKLSDKKQHYFIENVTVNGLLKIIGFNKNNKQFKNKFQNQFMLIVLDEKQKYPFKLCLIFLPYI